MIVGRVKKVFSKAWPGRNGTVYLHSFQLEGDSAFYRTGTSKLVDEGRHVKFAVEGNNNVVEASLEFVQPTPPAEAPAARSAPPAREDFNARQQYWENKERHDLEVTQPRITYAGASRDAIAVAGLALQHGLLTFGNAGKGAKLPMLLDYIAEVTAALYHQRLNPAMYPQPDVAAPPTTSSEDMSDE